MASLPLRRRILAAWVVAGLAGAVTVALGGGALSAMSAGRPTLALTLLLAASALAWTGHVSSIHSLTQPWHQLSDVLARLARQAPASTPADAPPWRRARLLGPADDPVQLFAAHVSRASARLGQLAPRLDVAAQRLTELSAAYADEAGATAAAARQAEACLQRAGGGATAPSAPAGIDTAAVEMAVRQVGQALARLEAADAASATSAAAATAPPATTVASTEALALARRSVALSERQATALGEVSVPVGAWADSLARLQSCLAAAHAAARSPAQGGGQGGMATVAEQLHQELHAGWAGQQALSQAVADAAAQVAEMGQSGRALCAEAKAALSAEAPSVVGAPAGPPPLIAAARAAQGRAEQVVARARGAAGPRAGPRPAAGLMREISQAGQHVTALMAAQAPAQARQEAMAQAARELGELRDDVQAIVAARPPAARAGPRRALGQKRSLLGIGQSRRLGPRP